MPAPLCVAAIGSALGRHLPKDLVDEALAYFIGRNKSMAALPAPQGGCTRLEADMLDNAVTFRLHRACGCSVCDCVPMGLEVETGGCVGGYRAPVQKILSYSDVGPFLPDPAGCTLFVSPGPVDTIMSIYASGSYGCHILFPSSAALRDVLDLLRAFRDPSKATGSARTTMS